MFASVGKNPSMIRVTLLCGRVLSGRAFWRLLNRVENQKPVKNPKPKKSREQYQRIFWTIRGHYPIKQGFWGKSHQKVHPKVRRNLCRKVLCGTFSVPERRPSLFVCPPSFPEKIAVLKCPLEWIPMSCRKFSSSSDTPVRSVIACTHAMGSVAATSPEEQRAQSTMGKLLWHPLML